MEGKEVSDTTVAQIKPEIILFRGFTWTLRHVWSPFVVKLEARLRFAGVPYKAAAGTPREAPRGKVPYIQLGNNPALIGDSTIIIRTLIDQGIMPDLNKELSGEDKARDLAIRALLEDKLYFFLVRERWEDNYYKMRDGVLEPLPYPVRMVVGYLVHRRTMEMLYGQGVLRYTKVEAAALRREIWEAIAEMLKESQSKLVLQGACHDILKPFWILGGQNPTEADAVVFGFIVSSLVCEAGPETANMIRSFPVLLQYATAIHDTYFNEYQGWK